MTLAALILSASLLLPGESCTNAPLPCAPFPDRMSAFVWRNWFCVPKDRLAETVGATVEDLVGLAGEMGLPPEPRVEPEWERYGYITVIRRNWHLLDYPQLLTLLGWDREKMRDHLLNDDYLFSKLGNLKPRCGELVWQADAALATRPARRRIAAILREENADRFDETPRFAFVRELSRTDASKTQRTAANGPARISSGYFADCLDPLGDDEIASFPEGLLARYAENGVNGVWLHVVLNTLAKDSFFTEFGAGAERRQRNLKRLVDRAAKYGIKVYLYFNEPRPMPISFFERNEAYAACRGTTDWKGLVSALCLQTPEVRRWLRAAIGEVFRAAPGLGGVFTITASENLVHCQAHGDRAHYARASRREPTCRPELFCPRCEKLDFAHCAADLNALIADAVHAVDPSAKVFVWDWGWDGFLPSGDVGAVLTRLPTNNVSFLTVSARGLPLDVDGTPSKVNEYTLSQVGPSDASRAKWAAARQAGLGLAAKAQPSGSWEIASVPYIPVMDNVAAHAVNLMRADVSDVVVSWTCGAYPAPNLAVFNGVRPSDRSPDDVLRRVAAERYGTEAAPQAVAVWKGLSKGFSRYPFTSRLLYHGPHHLGPANPLYPQPTGYASTMTGIPYDDLDGWRRQFPRKTYVARFQEMSEAFSRGADAWADVCACAEPRGRALAREELGILRTIALNFASTADQARFVEARERGDGETMRAVTGRELARAKELLPIVAADSRLGYESASQYFFVPQDIREKIVACRLLLDDAARPAQAAAPVSRNFGVRAVQLDLARQMETVPFVTNYLARAAAAGFNTVVLYLEDRVRTPTYPYPTPDESYSLSEMSEIVSAATRLGLDVVPVVSPLGHTERFLRHSELRAFGEDCGGVGRFGPCANSACFCLENPEARAWMERYLTEVASVFPGKNFHFGFDETFNLGFCSRCRPIVRRDGLAALYLRHIRWAHGLSSRLGKRMWIWDDFFDFFPEEMAKLPRDILLCCWNYSKDIDAAGPRAHFGGRLRRDTLGTCERLGIECLFCVCPWPENVRTFTEYASRRKTAGVLMTQWEMTIDFHGTFWPRIRAAADGWWGSGTGYKASFPSLDETELSLVSGLLTDIEKLRYRQVTEDRILNGVHETSKLDYWRAAVRALKGVPSRPGTGEIPADPLSEAASLEDLVSSAELALLTEETRTAARVLYQPERTADESAKAKARLRGIKTRWQELQPRRDALWKAWRPGCRSKKRAKYAAHLPKIVDALLEKPDVAPADEWLLEVDFAMADTHAAPVWTVEGRLPGGTWATVATGTWKPSPTDRPHSARYYPARLSAAPSEMRVSCKGYGAGEICHVSLRNRSGRLVPSAVISVSGSVRDAENLLIDDLRAARFGLPDCTDTFLHPERAEETASVVLALTGSAE